MDHEASDHESNDHEDGDYNYERSSFEQSYRCYPMSFIEKPHLEKGDKIVMPPSALSRLASLHIDYPMLFELCNPAANRVSHCGVMEFIAEEGTVFLPQWMMENMCLEEGNVVCIKNASLLKGKYVKLQPHTKDFLDISNPKALLETALRNFSCLTIGDTIVVPYNNKKYNIDIIETKPFNAVSIIETDCEVDFAPPLDYIEPAKPAAAPSAPLSKEPTEEEANKFVSFTGVGRRLDGKSSSLEAPTSGIVKSHEQELANVLTASSASSCKRSGKLVFGSTECQPKKQVKVTAMDTNPEPQKKVKTKFQAFTGKGYSLKG
ncbi:Ubiquitin fusion degradation protein 1-like protein [Thalictrum thalictroides]|uniref:Ubiquitin fusion degradation protein 1-like protein n=1 Tax=Thalictrum thalictroides TaxID=46969 RepID=A0A7J6UUJ9_THATH|nr:Ubiquitin fusion degradation protein 1-like protein [Thalictrum thalictroides]